MGRVTTKGDNELIEMLYGISATALEAAAHCPRRPDVAHEMICDAGEQTVRAVLLSTKCLGKYKSEGRGS